MVYDTRIVNGAVVEQIGRAIAEQVDHTLLCCGPNCTRCDPGQPTFDELYNELLAQEVELHAAKRNDYTGGGDPLANYKAAAASVGLELWQVLLSRLYEKAYRLGILMGGQRQAVHNETIRDTCLDMSVIAKLLAIQWELHDERPDEFEDFTEPDECEPDGLGEASMTTNVPPSEYQLRLFP